MKRYNNGFTLIELVVVIAFLGLASVLFLTQKNNAEASARDEQRKTSINAMYYGLEESYYAAHKNYPANLSADKLPAMDSALLLDPNGISIEKSESDYRYTSIDCNDAGECASYSLRANLEGEADYVKDSRH
ncbi:MAG: type II secretion system GspH family protein [bacterium]|nr:type II secretion system GspH family protein [bacterium]MDN5835285.1 type II secretion system GspH family protein [bacterium]